MIAHPPLTTAEKERIYAEKLRGRSLPAIALALGCSPATVRKWWRVARDHGRAALHHPRRGRRTSAVLSRSAPVVKQQALALKRAHPAWGPDRVLGELRADPALADLPLPSRSRLTALFHTACPELVVPRRPAPAPPAAPPRPTAVHECWQLDCQEAIPLVAGHRASICTIREPVGAAILASQAFDVTSGDRGRRLRWEEVRGVIRSACTEWETLPDAIQTDHEAGLAGAPSDPYPSHLTLWLVGLGVVHQFIRPHTPTDQPQIERTHRTLDGFVGLPDRSLDLAALQRRLDRERAQHNHFLPSRASDCAGRPPLVAHPALLQPRRRYRPEWERVLFDEQRVYAYLASIALTRRVSSVGQIQIGAHVHSVGRVRAGQTVAVVCDAATHTWVVSLADGTVIKQLPIQGVDVTSLTGIPATPEVELPPIQLTLPLAA
jgi:transposase-like protein